MAVSCWPPKVGLYSAAKACNQQRGPAYCKESPSGGWTGFESLQQRHVFTTQNFWTSLLEIAFSVDLVQSKLISHARAPGRSHRETGAPGGT